MSVEANPLAAPLFALLVGATTLGAIVVEAQPLRRVLRPFVIETTSGDEYRNDFSGGLWQPRIGTRDVDGDGRLDLFALNPDGELRYYRNEGAFGFHRILPSPYDTLPISNWFRFADLDGDGDAELLTAGPRSEVMVLDNDGTDAAPHFRQPARLLTSATGDTIRTQRETVPSLVDIDADGDIDLFAGNLDGSITFYENTGTAESIALTFRTAEYMGILVISGGIVHTDADESTQSSSRHGASVLDFADLDGDGDLDMLFGDAFTVKLLHFTNFGTATRDTFSMERLDTAFRPSGDDVESDGFNQPVTGDFDGDGDLDAIVSSLLPSSSVLPLTLYENTGTTTSARMQRRSIDLTSEIDLGRSAAPATIDDATRRGLIVGSESGSLTYYARVGDDPTRYREQGTLALPGLFQTVPAAGDLDGDGIAEVVVGEAFGSIVFHRFVDGSLARFGDTFQLNRNASPTLVDLDVDGDLDLFCGAENGRFHYFENVGSPTAASFERRTSPSPFDRLDVGSDSAPRFFDLDGDGDLDAMVGGRTAGASGVCDTLRFFVRDGSGFAESSAWPAVMIARNPVPLGLSLREGRFVLVGDLAGGIKALVDTGTISRIEDDEQLDGIGMRLDGTRLMLPWPDVDRADVRVVDVDGRLALTRRFDRATSDAGLQLDGLPSGVYFVEVIASGRRRTGRIRLVR